MLWEVNGGNIASHRPGEEESGIRGVGGVCGRVAAIGSLLAEVVGLVADFWTGGEAAEGVA